MKSPPIQYPDSDAHRFTEEFIAKNPKKSSAIRQPVPTEL